MKISGNKRDSVSRHFDILTDLLISRWVMQQQSQAALRQPSSRFTSLLDPEMDIILWYDFWINPINRPIRGVRPLSERCFRAAP
jgi:hypothetical protein